ncbi:hypothetical protein L0U88_09765 [Flavihumibacter sp. RY-1]|uniref:Uncharacterized protein n=1 Tax=Flavihumibacter fluminis TaxID=2909236 RepID=A0ABS9BJX4_9BACT|nr:hypothetical protein [Flavihumibacter fluminis]MCF1714911.1 hypothetical protein [Flavihumibacter fluminis]
MRRENGGMEDGGVEEWSKGRMETKETGDNLLLFLSGCTKSVRKEYSCDQNQQLNQ